MQHGKVSVTNNGRGYNQFKPVFHDGYQEVLYASHACIYNVLIRLDPRQCGPWTIVWAMGDLFGHMIWLDQKANPSVGTFFVFLTTNLYLKLLEASSSKQFHSHMVCPLKYTFIIMTIISFLTSSFLPNWSEYSSSVEKLLQHEGKCNLFSIFFFSKLKKIKELDYAQ